MNLFAFMVLFTVHLLALRLREVATVRGAVIVNLLVDTGFIVLDVASLPGGKLP